MNLNCIVVDDEPMARKLLQEYIEETDFLILVGTAENPVKAIPLLKTNDIDLVFLVDRTIKDAHGVRVPGVGAIHEEEAAAPVKPGGLGVDRLLDPE